MGIDSRRDLHHVEPGSLARKPLESIDIIVATREDAPGTIARFAEAVGIAAPAEVMKVKDGEALVWDRRNG